MIIFFLFAYAYALGITAKFYAVTESRGSSRFMSRAFATVREKEPQARPTETFFIRSYFREKTSLVVALQRE